MERWKDVVGYENIYQVSDKGNIKSVDRIDASGHKIKGHIRKPEIQKCGYLQIDLWKNGKGKQVLIHRIVAEAFIGACPPGYEVNHKDENKQNNCVDNLEYVTKSQNVSYGTRNERASQKIRKRIEQLTLFGELIATHDSATEASKATKVIRQHISQCCCGSRKSAGGYMWRFAV